MKPSQSCSKRRFRRSGARLHRMIFVRFGISIALTFLVVRVLLSRVVLDQQSHEPKWWGFGIGLLILWGVSGAIAHRLVRPLWRVTEVARDIGEGDLSSRVDLGRRAPGEIGDLARAINHMAERIEKQVADQRALLAAVSHEIRTPLGHMRVIAELARDGDPARLAELEGEIESVNSLVDKLLASSRLEFDSLNLRPLDATQVCLQALERADLDAGLLDVKSDRTTVLGDATLLTRAIGNLLENAKRHAHEILSLEIEGTGASLRLTVFDRGPGFVDAEASFDSFARPENPADGSLGLGLPLVRRIAEAHQGTLDIENHTPGARVSLTLPVAEST